MNAAKTLESWAKLAEGKDTASLKSLMRERLQGRSWGPTEELRDADIPTWVGSLKRIDKDAAQFFSRSVKVVITAPDWPAVEVQHIAELDGQRPGRAAVESHAHAAQQAVGQPQPSVGQRRFRHVGPGRMPPADRSHGD